MLTENKIAIQGRFGCISDDFLFILIVLCDKVDLRLLYDKRIMIGKEKCKHVRAICQMYIFEFFCGCYFVLLLCINSFEMLFNVIVDVGFKFCTILEAEVRVVRSYGLDRFGEFM